MSLYQKYFKNVKHLDEVDVYRVLNLFDVTDHALGHAVKKLLLCGVRTGGKTTIQEVVEARDTLNRWVEMEREDGNHTELYDFSHPTKITSDDLFYNIEEVELVVEVVEEEEVVDMSDPATWLPGDIIKCVSGRNCYFTPNRKYVFKELTHNGNVTYAHVENDDEGDPNGLRVDFFEWHARSLSASLNKIINFNKMLD